MDITSNSRPKPSTRRLRRRPSRTPPAKVRRRSKTPPAAVPSGSHQLDPDHVWNTDDEEELELVSSRSPSPPPLVLSSEPEDWADTSGESGNEPEDDIPYSSSESEEEEVSEDDRDTAEVILDTVSVHNASVESLDDDEPLSTYQQKPWQLTKPGTAEFFWKEEGYPRICGFEGTPGVHPPEGIADSDLSSSSSPLDCFSAFWTREIRSHVVTETNR